MTPYEDIKFFSVPSIQIFYTPKNLDYVEEFEWKEPEIKPGSADDILISYHFVLEGLVYSRTGGTDNKKFGEIIISVGEKGPKEDRTLFEILDVKIPKEGLPKRHMFKISQKENEENKSLEYFVPEWFWWQKNEISDLIKDENLSNYKLKR